MNRKTRLAVGLATGGVLAAAAVGVAGPALAGGGPFGHPSVSASARPGFGGGMGAGGAGMGMGAGGAGLGLRDGSCLSASPGVASGALSEQQKAGLAAMAQEEKLAGDLYQAFADKYSARVFDQLARAEDQHLSAVRTLLTRYSVKDPTAGQPAGKFTDAAVQASYDKLLAQGQGGQAAALAAGQQVEKTDMADLTKALSGLSAADVKQVYQRLLDTSQRHLTALTNWSGR